MAPDSKGITISRNNGSSEESLRQEEAFPGRGRRAAGRRQVVLQEEFAELQLIFARGALLLFSAFAPLC